MLSKLYQIAFVVARSLAIDAATEPTPNDPDTENPLHSHNPEGEPLPGLGGTWYQAAVLRQSQADGQPARRTARER